MRIVAIAALVVALALVLLGLIVEALGWLIVIGLVLLLVAVIAGWIGIRRAATMARGDR